MNSELFAWIFLNRVPFMSPARFRKLLEYAGSAQDALALPTVGLQSLGVPDGVADFWSAAFRDPELEKAAQAELVRADRGEFRIILESAEDYPELLRELPGRPPVLYSKGVWPLPTLLPLGVVGTRRPTPYGVSVTKHLVQALVEQQAQMISGMALGIDRTAHETTLKFEGHTVGVLGHGFGTLYPRQNADLYKVMAERGTLLTEFPFETGPSRLSFPRRNRIISGLSRGIVVIEAGVHSGALITARYAAEQGRDVFAVPGPIDRETSAGCHRLIQEGVKLIESATDILEEYVPAAATVAVTTMPLPAPRLERERILDVSGLNPLEKHLAEKLFEDAFTVDELSQAVAQPIDLLMNALLSLELKGKIRLLGGQRYAYNS